MPCYLWLSSISSADTVPISLRGLGDVQQQLDIKDFWRTEQGTVLKKCRPRTVTFVLAFQWTENLAQHENTIPTNWYYHGYVELIIICSRFCLLKLIHHVCCGRLCHPYFKRFKVFSWIYCLSFLHFADISPPFRLENKWHLKRTSQMSSYSNIRFLKCFSGEVYFFYFF